MSESEYENPGIKGQLQYPEVEVDAERAAAYAGGKEDSLYEDERLSGWQNPADNVPPGDELEDTDESDGEDDGK